VKTKSYEFRSDDAGRTFLAEAIDLIKDRHQWTSWEEKWRFDKIEEMWYVFITWENENG